MTEMEKNLKDLEELYNLGMLDAEGYAFQKKQLEDAQQGTALSCVDEQYQHGVAHNNSFQDEQMREGFSLSSAPSTDRAMPSPVQQTAAPPPQTPAFEAPKIHVAVGGKEIGAFEREEVIKKISVGEIRKDAQVWKDGMDNWVNAGDLPELEKYVDEVKDHFEAEEIYKEAVKNREEAAWSAYYAKYPNEYSKGDLAKVEPCWAKYSELIMKAAEMGNAKAQAEVAEGYDRGNYRFPKDNAKANYWYKKAAEQGDPKSCFKVGSAYMNYSYYGFGIDVPLDYDKAAELLNKAVAGAASDKDLLKDANKALKELHKKQGKGGGGLLGGLFGKKK